METKTNAKTKWGSGKLTGVREGKKRVVYIAIKEEEVFQCPIDRKVVFLVFFGPYWTHHYC